MRKNKIWRFKLPIHLCFDSKRNNRNSLIRKHFLSTWQIEHQHGDEARAQKIMCSVMGISNQKEKNGNARIFYMPIFVLHSILGAIDN